jgi:hypothetical protein
MMSPIFRMRSILFTLTHSPPCLPRVWAMLGSAKDMVLKRISHYG